jgi:hypothetical protein
MRNRTAAANKVLLAPTIAAAEPQITDPRVIAPCEIMITAAFTRPRAQLGIARCAATQSSEADSVHPTPATAATTKNTSSLANKCHQHVSQDDKQIAREGDGIGRESEP